MINKVTLENPNNFNNESVNINYNDYYLKDLYKLNELLKNTSYSNSSLNDIINNIELFDENKRGDILYYSGSILGHELYFTLIKKKSTLSGSLKNKIIDTYGNYENFINDFINISSSLTGSGFTYLVVDKFKNLRIINMPNYDSPVSYNFIPILSLDLFEHAYFLNYKSNREKYIRDFFDIVDFDFVNRLYEEAIS